MNQCIELCSKILRGSKWTKSFLYDPFKNFFRCSLCSYEYMLYYMSSNRPYRQHFSDEYKGREDGPVLGILKDPFHGHQSYMKACMELGIGYRAIDIFASNWIEQVKNSGCNMFLVWPEESIQEVKRLYDDRLRFIVEQMGKRIFPELLATWLYGSKERQCFWMELNDVYRPWTKIFYRKDEALDFVSNLAAYPLIAKTDIGAVSSGVAILRSKRMSERYIQKAFGKGIQGYYSDRQARQWRHVLLQEYLLDVKEWRVHRIGDSFFGFGKVKRGDFHSGSGETDWILPPVEAFNLAWEITERGGFKSMAVDIFETLDGRFLVNELQCVYGQH